MYRILRPLLFHLEAENAHNLALRTLRVVSSLPGGKTTLRAIYSMSDPKLAQTLRGITFPNPVGLAAGFDKDALVPDGFAALGIGFVEVGTLTPLPQLGNPRPRIFRLPEDYGIINRMGFNNNGTHEAAKRLARLRVPVPLGVNIGRNKDTSNERALDDYLTAFDVLAQHANYLVVNVSSPNTPGLRDLQARDKLTELLGAIAARRSLVSHDSSSQGQSNAKRLLLFVKISPDLYDNELVDIATVVRDIDFDGVIATNTTVNRDGLYSPRQVEAGGLSGKPLATRARMCIARIRELLGNEPLLIGVGGIFSSDDALAALRAGADLVQVYSGMVYRGPSIARHINSGIVAALKRGEFAFRTHN